jgi:enterochelin esterase-like enzyme
LNRRIRSIPAALACAVTCVAIAAGPALAQEDGSPVSIGTYRTLHSQVLGEDRTLLINLPEGYDETVVDYPVLYVLYGGQVRGYFAESVHIVDRLQEAGLIPPLIIVGVKNVDRYRDNLPVNRYGEEGGAESFLTFFTDELIPFIDGSYRTKDFRILLGPQAGASFSLYALMERPGVFAANITTNPFWNRSVREYLLGRADTFFSREGPLRSFFFITCNTNDDDETTMEYLNRLVAVVDRGRRSGFTMMLNPVGEREADTFIPSPGLKEGLEAYFSDYMFPEGREVAGLDDLVEYYRRLSADYGYEVDIPAKVLIMKGDELYQGGKPEVAQGLFEYVVEHYPSNLDGYHRLAELHRSLRDYERSIEYYEDFLERRHEPFIAERMNALRAFVNESAAYAVERAVDQSGIDAGTAKYRELRADAGDRFYFDEAEFNSLGYVYVAKGMVDAAIEIFKMNVEMNPESANVYDSLGEAYLLNDNAELAIETYRKVLELDPGNAGATGALERLGAMDQ